MEIKNVELNISDNIAYLTLSRPDTLNVFSKKTLNDIMDALLEIEHDGGIKVVVFSSSTKNVFTAGANIKEMVEMGPDEAEEFSRIGHSIADKLERDLPPVIIVLRGIVLGGGLEFACACDIRVASKNSSFGFPEITIGVIPGWGGTQRLCRIIGPTKAKEMIFTGTFIDSKEALNSGLVNYIVDDDRLEEKALSIAKDIAQKGRPSLIAAKRSINNVLDHWSLKNGLEFEIEQWREMFTKVDQKEGMRAFLEKRPPKL